MQFKHFRDSFKLTRVSFVVVVFVVVNFVNLTSMFYFLWRIFIINLCKFQPAAYWHFLFRYVCFSLTLYKRQRRLSCYEKDTYFYIVFYSWTELRIRTTTKAALINFAYRVQVKSTCTWRISMTLVLFQKLIHKAAQHIFGSTRIWTATNDELYSRTAAFRHK